MNLYTPNTTHALVEYLTRAWQRIAPYLSVNNKQTNSSKKPRKERGVGETLGSFSCICPSYRSRESYKCSDKNCGYFHVDRRTYGSCLWYHFREKVPNCPGH